MTELDITGIETNCRKCNGFCPSGVLDSGLCFDCEVPRPCAACLNEFGTRTEAALVTGRRYSDTHGRMIVTHRYLCDMHKQDVTASRRA